MNYLTALLICVVAAVCEGLCAGRDPMARLKATKQPSWSPPNWVWVLIGIAWYAICFVGLVRLLPFWADRRLPVILLTALMLANGSANILGFRMKRLDLAFYFLFPYWLLLAAFFYVACPLDRLTCGLFAIYAVYQAYAAVWGYQLWRMNPRKSAPRPRSRLNSHKGLALNNLSRSLAAKGKLAAAKHGLTKVKPRPKDLPPRRD